MSGCKIKALRAKTNTYIKTPVRDAEPVFVVTGRKEDVAAAKTEILSAAEHFSQIRATRRPGGPPGPNVPGQVTKKVQVPYRMVGLIVGAKGNFIKKIQQQTNTYIVTPSREKAPVFEVTGVEENVDQARRLMYLHIAEHMDRPFDAKSLADLEGNANDVSLVQPRDLTNGDALLEESMASLSMKERLPPNPFLFTDNFLNNNNKMFSTMPLGQDFFPLPTSTNGYSPNQWAAVDEGIGDIMSPPGTSTFFWSKETDSASFATLPRRTNSFNSQYRNHSSASSNGSGQADALVDSNANLGLDHNSVRRVQSDPLNMSALTASAFVPFSPISSGSSLHSSAAESLAGSMVSSPDTSPTSNGPSHLATAHKTSCFVCLQNDAAGVLFPCGHEKFCLDCAGLILKKPDNERKCPCCQEPVTQFYNTLT